MLRSGDPGPRQRRVCVFGNVRKCVWLPFLCVFCVFERALYVCVLQDVEVGGLVWECLFLSVKSGACPVLSMCLRMWSQLDKLSCDSYTGTLCRPVCESVVVCVNGNVRKCFRHLNANINTLSILLSFWTLIGWDTFKVHGKYPRQYNFLLLYKY